jgi:predicted PurR-regulated permease PerM
LKVNDLVPQNATQRLLIGLLIAAIILYLGGAIWQLALQFAEILLLFFLAWLTAFLLNPLADLITKRLRAPRIMAVLGVYLGLLLMLAVIVTLILPTITSQLIRLGGNIPTYVADIPATLDNFQQWLAEHGIRADLATIYRSEEFTLRFQSWGAGAAEYTLGIAQGVATTMVNIIIVLVLSFYITLDGHKIRDSLISFLPERNREEAQFFAESVNTTFGGYIRGTFIIGVIYGLTTALVMGLARLEFIAPVSIFAGLMMVIPFLGAFLSVIPPLLIAFFSTPWQTTLIVFLALLGLQQVVLNVIAPRVLSSSVGLHPLLVFAALLVGIKIAGFWGAIFGVPIMAVIYSMALFFYQRANQSNQATDSLTQPE